MPFPFTISNLSPVKIISEIALLSSGVLIPIERAPSRTLSISRGLSGRSPRAGPERSGSAACEVRSARRAEHELLDREHEELRRAIDPRAPAGLGGTRDCPERLAV